LDGETGCIVGAPCDAGYANAYDLLRCGLIFPYQCNAPFQISIFEHSGPWPKAAYLQELGSTNERTPYVEYFTRDKKCEYVFPIVACLLVKKTTCFVDYLHTSNHPGSVGVFGYLNQTSERLRQQVIIIVEEFEIFPTRQCGTCIAGKSDLAAIRHKHGNLGCAHPIRWRQRYARIVHYNDLKLCRLQPLFQHTLNRARETCATDGGNDDGTKH
jgi:hypothetical protein